MASRTTEQRVAVPTLRASWLTVAFVHWRVPAERIQSLLPAGLTADEYDGSAWVSMTPFMMADMRPLGLPTVSGGLARVPGIKALPRLPDVSRTPETNLRTYVHGPDGRDGLWFLALDIGNPALAATLRGLVGAPYHVGRLGVDRVDGVITYTGSRIGGSHSYRLVLRPGARVEPSDLEIWLTSRWRAYTKHVGRLLVTPVEHEPWPLQTARVHALEQTVTDSVGLRGLSDPLVHFSEGVTDVRVGVPRVLRGS